MQKGEIMTDIKGFNSPKYANDDAYVNMGNGVYSHDCKYCTSLSFVQEPQLGEGTSANDISQYPMEDILERFLVYVSDFYPALNTADSKQCVLEFSSPNKADLLALRTIIGKHVYNKIVSDINGQRIELVIE